MKLTMKELKKDILKRALYLEKDNKILEDAIDQLKVRFESVKFRNRKLESANSVLKANIRAYDITIEELHGRIRALNLTIEDFEKSQRTNKPWWVRIFS